MDGWRDEVALGRVVADAGQNVPLGGEPLDLVVQLMVACADKEYLNAVEVAGLESLLYEMEG